MPRQPMTRPEIKETLQMACNGRLHHLTDKQRKAVNSIHLRCVVQALCIGMIFTAIPGMCENFLVWQLETIGTVDAYWTCDRTIGDPEGAPWGVGNLTLATCELGLCTSVPAMNASEYLAMGGNEAMGGAWTDGDGDGDCTPLLATWSHDQNTVKMFWALNILGIGLGITCEISLLIFTALRSAVKISSAIDLRLIPLNADRAKVAVAMDVKVIQTPLSIFH